MTNTRYVLSPLWAKNPPGLHAAWDSVCVFMQRGEKSFVAPGIQREDVSLIAMITWKGRGFCRGFGVSLCILGMMDEMIQPKGKGQLSLRKLRPLMV